MHKYRILGKKGEGTFSEVLKCQQIQDGTYYACKKMKQNYQSLEQVNNLREIQAMKRLSPHANILELKEVIFDRKTGNLSLICELMDMNIYELIRGRRHYLPEQKVKNYIFQLIKALEHMHRNGIFHRDVKPENVLIRDDHLKLADFGSCRSVYSKQPFTEYISTRWYRAPECLLTDGYYSYQMDMWSVGCVFFEILSLHPLFPGANEVDQIAKIHDVMGTPDTTLLNKFRNKARGINYNFPSKKGTGIEKLLPHASQQSVEVIYKLCTYDPDERITAKQVIRHHYFKELRDADKKKQHAEKKKAAQAGDQASVVSEETAKESHPEGKETEIETYKTGRKARRKAGSKLHESENFSNSVLPKVQNAKVAHSISTYPTQSFGTTSFPKLHTNRQSMLPSLANTHYNKHHAGKTYQPAASKNVYGHFQLPQIHKSKGAQF
ncbi:MAPK/MAK/MRK overlapping kinase-like [Diadema setosum]|uniref:MAPK/MAK/MRK overlapping kinase-like n=1 Tax=Diadema antillarum TaxID=105358 RepID=UPI003A8B4574